MALQAAVRAALAVSGILTLALAITMWTAGAPLVLAGLGVLALLGAIAVSWWAFAPLRQSPSDARIARYIEESEPSFDDRLASAVGLSSDPGAAGSTLAGAMLADASQRAAGVDPASIVTSARLRRAGLRAASALVLLALVLFVGRQAARQSFDALSLTLFPSRVSLEVTPGTTRIQAGSPLEIRARLIGNRAPVIARLLRAGVDADPVEGIWRPTEMASDGAGGFTVVLEPSTASFRYRVDAGTIASPVFDITVVRPPRVARIDVEYTYPGLGLPPRLEEDAGDIYAPAGTQVRLRVHADREAAAGQMTLADGASLPLAPESPTLLTASLTVRADSSYRVALADRDGFTIPGDTEYFIRTVEDRPPEVRVVAPARDRTVTMLEEIDIEAEAEDDFGVDRLELVYAVRGGAETAVPLAIARRATWVSGSHTLFLEDLDVRPGDFVSYYVRARDLPRGRRASEARSDIFFLEVRPFEQEFTLAQSQAMAGRLRQASRSTTSSPRRRRSSSQPGSWIAAPRRQRREVGRGHPHGVAGGGRAEEARGGDRKRLPGLDDAGSRGSGPRVARGAPGGLRAGQARPEEDAMAAAAAAMGRAVESLERAPDRSCDSAGDGGVESPACGAGRREEAAGHAAAGGRRQRRQPREPGHVEPVRQGASAAAADQLRDPRERGAARVARRRESLDKISELARRQDELLRRQQELARDRERMTAEELKRELEQPDARAVRAAAAGRGAGAAPGDESTKSTSSRAGRASRESGGRSQSQGQRGQQAGQASGQGQPGAVERDRRRMRDVSEEMRGAAGELRRDDPAQASARGRKRAAIELRDIERELRPSAPDERRRALGEMQLEARQLADAERQVGAELGEAGSGRSGQRRPAPPRRRAGAAGGRAPRGCSRSSDRQARRGRRAPRRERAGRRSQAAAAARDLERQRIRRADAPGGGRPASGLGGRRQSVRGAGASEAGTDRSGAARRARERARGSRDRRSPARSIGWPTGWRGRARRGRSGVAHAWPIGSRGSTSCRERIESLTRPGGGA